MSDDNLVWKPLDVGGLRLYMVGAEKWEREPNGAGMRCVMSHMYVVAATSPRDAARRVRERFKGVEGASITGHPLDVLQPAEWWSDGVPAGGAPPAPGAGR